MDENEKEEEISLWERQPWDTNQSWAAFRFYLEQDPPRTFIGAYVRWCRSRDAIPYINKATGRPKPIPSFECWWLGKDRQGIPIPGAVGWKERANAWDREQERIVNERWARRRRKLIEDEYRLGESLRRRGEQMLSSPPVDYKESDIGTHIDLAFKVLRRAMGMEQSRVALDWKSNLKQAGIDPDVAFEDLVNAILNGSAPAGGEGTNDRGGSSGGSKAKA